ncbi:unnamed protein product [Rhizopus stolonifer]
MTKEIYISSDDESEYYEVEKLLNHHLYEDGEYEYLIKWKDYSDENNTWEAESNISENLIEAYWASKEKVIRNLSTDPPEGKTWNDIECLLNVFETETELFAQVKWKWSNSKTFIPTEILRRFSPRKLIEFYQDKVNCEFSTKA